MNQLFRFHISLLICLSLFGWGQLHAQSSGRNYSVQVGYQLKWLSPDGHNYAIDSLFNLQLASGQVPLERFNLTEGYTFGFNLHRNRASIRLYGETFQTTSSSTTTSSAPIRTDAAITGWAAEFGISSSLVDINQVFTLGVGGSLSYHRFQSRVLQASADGFPEEESLPVISGSGQVGLRVMMPLRVYIRPQFAVSIEPYYNVFFADLGAQGFSEALGNPPVDITRLRSAPDHVGINFSIMVYLLPFQ